MGGECECANLRLASDQISFTVFGGCVDLCSDQSVIPGSDSVLVLPGDTVIETSGVGERRNNCSGDEESCGS